LFDQRDGPQPVLGRWLTDMMRERAFAIVESRQGSEVLH
jgi:hypothetical protein